MRQAGTGALGLAAFPYSTGAGEPPPFEQIHKIDAHAHIFVDRPAFVDMLRANNIQLINVCVRGDNIAVMKWREQFAEDMYRKYGPAMQFCSTFDVSRRNEAQYVREVKDWLDRSFEAGAIMTKIWKEVGMGIKNQAGAYIMPDDSTFDPIYEHLAQSRKPLLAHLAEPRAAWLPLNPESLHYPYYSKNPEWHWYNRKNVPTWEQLIAARDNILAKHPRLTLIGSHMGSMAYDVDVVAERFEKYPNFYVDCAARTKDLTRQPAEKVRNFLIKYSDRVLYGTDLITYADRKNADVPPDQRAGTPDEALSIYRLDYRYYAQKGTIEFYGKEVECLDLPRTVLENLYRKNALRVIPDLKVA